MTSFGAGIGTSVLAFQEGSFSKGVYDLGYTVILTEEAAVSPSLAISVGLRYQSLEGESSRAISMPSIPETSWRYRHALNLRSVELPVLVEWNTSRKSGRGLHLSGGFAVSYAIASSRQIDTVYRKGSTTVVSPVVEDEVQLRTRANSHFGLRGVIRLGKHFPVADRRLNCGIEYSWDLSTWRYPSLCGPRVSYIRDPCKELAPRNPNGIVGFPEVRPFSCEDRTVHWC